MDAPDQVLRYQEGYDYRAYVVTEAVDGELIGLSAAARLLGFADGESVRRLVGRGELPARRGEQPRHKRYHVPAWALDGWRIAQQREETRAKSSGSPPSHPAGCAVGARRDGLRS